MNSSINTYLLLDLDNRISDKRYEASEEEIDTLNPFFVNFANSDYKIIKKYSEKKPIAIYCYGINYEDDIAQNALSIFSPIILHNKLEDIYKYVFVSFWSSNDNLYLDYTKTKPIIIKNIVAKFKTFSQTTKKLVGNTDSDIALDGNGNGNGYTDIAPGSNDNTYTDIAPWRTEHPLTQ